MSQKARYAATAHKDRSGLVGERSRCLTDIDVKPTIVTFKSDGALMAVIRVESGTSVVWRVRLPDTRLCSGAFANAARAMRWIAAGQPLHHSQDDQDRDVGAKVALTASRGILFHTPEPKDEKVEPEWEVVEWRRRSDPVWSAGPPSSPKKAKLD
jgi:hypothetical protein